MDVYGQTFSGRVRLSNLSFEHRVGEVRPGEVRAGEIRLRKDRVGEVGLYRGRVHEIRIGRT